MTITERISRAGSTCLLALTTMLTGVHAHAQLTINAESFQVSVTGGTNDIGSMTLQGTCATLPATFTFQASGNASGALNPGGTTFTEKGSFTIAAGSMPNTFIMTAFQASFSFPITTPAGQVTGVKSLNLSPTPFTNQIFSCDSNLLNFNVWTTYTAQIVTGGGNYVDQGRANVILGYFFTQASNYGFTENFTSTGSQPQTCVAPPSGMLGWWPGDGNTNDIVGGNNGMWVGTPAYAAGEVGSAFSFDGSSYVTVGNPSALQLTGNQFTLDGWVNPSAIKNDVVYFGKTAYGNNDYVVLFQFNELTGMMKTGSHEVILGSNFVPPVNQWTHVAFTYDGANLNLYVNGALISTAPQSGNLANDSPEFAIGGRALDPFGHTYRFPGLIDEVEVFNRALSAAEIQSIYFAGSAGKCKPNSNQPQATSLAFTSTSATTSDYNDAATVQARLTKTSDGSGVSGKTITFQLGSGAMCSAMTDTTGTAACSLTPNQAAGNYTLTATFAGDSNFSSSSASTPFTVAKEETVTKLAATNPTVAANGSPATFYATLKEDGVTPISGRTLTITVGSGAGAQSCSGVTDGTGTASCTITVNQAAGPNTVKAAFAGDAFYQPSSDAGLVTVFTFLGSGAGSFVIGDLNAITGNEVTFWGSQWAKVNALSGGPAPEAFKGFADSTSTNPPACGGTWMTAPGNSSNPPAGVPSYMGVVASSSIAKSGPSISGNIARLVVIKTDPGYASNPGHAGTGTVVAVLPCH